jgi:hypothetical protein
MTALKSAAYVEAAFVVVGSFALVAATFLCLMIIRLIVKHRAAYRRKGAGQ